MWIADNWKDYEILDCSGGEKLERWGNYLLVRPDPQVIWDTPKKNEKGSCQTSQKDPALLYDDADLHYDHLSGGALYRGYEFARGILWLIGIRHGISGRFHTCSSYGRQIHREVSVCTQAIFHSDRHTILFHLD